MKSTRSKSLATSACLVAITIASSGCANLGQKADQVVSDCENTRDEIVELTEKDRAARGYAVVKIYEPVEISRTANELKCTGTAHWSDGDNTKINYRSYLDSEGDRFVEYELVQ